MAVKRLRFPEKSESYLRPAPSIGCADPAIRIQRNEEPAQILLLNEQITRAHKGNRPCCQNKRHHRPPAATKRWHRSRTADRLLRSDPPANWSDRAAAH